MFRFSRINDSLLIALIAVFLADSRVAAQINSLDLFDITSRQFVPAVSSVAPANENGDERSNIILINLDDADVDLFADDILDAYLPNIKRMAADGVSFSNCHVVTPLCGPSRVCLLRGQYAHRTGIKTNVAAGPMNNGFSGAYQLFKNRGYEKEHLGVWMQRAGYRTMMVGKYLHGRMNPVDIPGWDDLYICFGGNYFATSRYSSRYPVAERRRATKDTQYRTVVEADESIWMIQEHAKRNSQHNRDRARQPFFLYIAPLAPHKPAGKTAMLQSEYENLGTEIRLNQTPDLNEPNISDKPVHLQVARHDRDVMDSMDEEHRKRVMATKSVDDLLGRLRETLKQTGFENSTYIFFTSDHGYQLGHNRMIAKKLPFHRNTVVPMFVVGPGIKPGKANHLLANIDLAPTFLEIAGGSAPVSLDGKSWVPIWTQPDQSLPSGFRKSLLIQNWEEKSQNGILIPASYASLRLSDKIFTEWSNGEKEYYDLVDDPYQTENRIGSLTKQQLAEFTRQLHELKQGENQPIVTLANPELISKNSLIRGFAEDDDAVAAVEVTILDPQGEKYWTGAKWEPKNSIVHARLLNPKGLISQWQTPVDFSGIKDNQSVVVEATARDALGNQSKGISVTLRIDAIDPETLLKLPVSGSTVESPVTLFGTCGDNHEMSGVELELYNIDQKTYWNGEEWVVQKSTFFKRVVQERWHSTIEIPKGRYRASARSRDQAGNYDATPSVTEFTVK